MQATEQLRLISKAWGNQSGYCFFPWIDGSADSREHRIRAYHEGPAFLWPRDKQKILEHLESHQGDDLYWCPSLFEKKVRRLDYAMDEHCLWADLDEKDPREIEDYPPTIAWETSPGRYQALWLINGGIMGASWPGNENQRMTYYVDADHSGWDSTQLMRIPGWDNHKFEYWQNGTKAVPGKLLWANGRRYQPDDFEDLPEVQGLTQVESILEDEVLHVDRREVWSRVKLKVSSRVREFVRARETSGDRSEVLWEIERELADAGCTVTEIVAIVKDTVWNKYEGRQDELKRLTIEASKALSMRSEEKTEKIEQELESHPPPTPLFKLLADVKQPEWIVNQIISKASCGFIAGQPKNFKSWIGLDLAFSVATGLPFLDHFSVRLPGPVLYIQEEDSAAMLKQRVSRVWPGKIADKMKLGADGEIEWHPGDPADEPEIMAVARHGFIISDPSWQEWLDEVIAAGFNGKPYALTILDPLMMIAGEVDENRSQEMTTKIFRPLKQLADKHQCAVQLVHHMGKGGDPAKNVGRRAGSTMLGSTANWAWGEDSLYLRFGKGGVVVVERESKHTAGGTFTVRGLRNKKWTPSVVDDRTETDDGESSPGIVEDDRPTAAERMPRKREPAVLKVLRENGRRMKSQSIAKIAGISTSGAYRQLKRLEAQGKVDQTKTGWKIIPEK